MCDLPFTLPMPELFRLFLPFRSILSENGTAKFAIPELERSELYMLNDTVPEISLILIKTHLKL